MPSGSVRFDWNGDVMVRRLAASKTRAVYYLAKTTAYYSLKAEAQAKQRAPWTDRTTNARSGLRGTYVTERSASGASFSIELSHSVPYGIFLETRNFSKKGRLAIIVPTLYGGQAGGRNAAGQFVAGSVGDQYMKAVQKVLDRMFGASS